ncbi:GTPase HflX [Halobiforma nitratireducens]|uniref:GTPase HflX n=1 Tax=Halobiforma nitratireducens JCM 10879 TaxID=1227454 RepID=M0LKE9_9EURY|nr:GTPase HflX [Halobiforma nitratireducens]EMA34097.1 GTP-binding proten HflX [Halobiforma nitratireducens JCM 10879]
MSRLRNGTERRRTVVATRASTSPDATDPADTDEISALVRAAGDEVVGEVTQSGPADSGSYLGSGKVAELTDLVADVEARRLVVDDHLTPSQHRTLESAMPDGTAVLDRYRLVLDIFEAGAGSRRAKLQVELARLRYDLPRVIESADEGLLNQMTEKGSRVYDLRDRIDRLERTLDELPDPAEQYRERRREEGFDLVTIAGYTNAGKSTLLHHLADDLSLSDADSNGETGDASTEKDATAAVGNRLFETLETTTRRTTIADRPVLATDTVGLVDDLPHDIVESFSATLSEAGAADVVVLVTDASDSETCFCERLAVSLETLATQGVEDDRIVPALNKVDRLSPDERSRRRRLAAERLPDDAASPIPISVLEGRNLDALRETVADRLPAERATLRLPNCDETMSLVSRAYDRTDVESVEYDGDAVTVVCRGRPSVLEQLRATASRIGVD